MRPGALLLVVATLTSVLAGCTTDTPEPEERGPSVAEPPLDCHTGAPPGEGPDRSVETLRLWIDSRGSWWFGLPVPVSPDGSTVAQWEHGLRTQGDVTDVAIVATERGQVLRISGSGAALVCSVVEHAGGRGGYAEAYLDARFTTARSDNSAFWVEHGAGTFAFWLLYEARSNYCGGDYSARGHGYPDAGWIYMSGGPGFWCT